MKSLFFGNIQQQRGGDGSYLFEDGNFCIFEDNNYYLFDENSSMQIGNVVIFMSGQSNSVGLASSTDLFVINSNLANPFGVNVWNGTSFETLDYPDNHNWPTHYSTVGAELSLMYALKQNYPQINFYLIKRAFGSEEINNWLSGGLRFTEYNNWFKNSLDSISLDKNDFKAFFVWDQGESDGNQTVEIANLYGGKLTSLIQYYRGFLNVNTLPFIARKHRSDIIGSIPYIENVIAQQETVVESDFYLVNSDGPTYTLADVVHFDSRSQNLLAEQYFNIISTYI